MRANLEFIGGGRFLLLGTAAAWMMAGVACTSDDSSGWDGAIDYTQDGGPVIDAPGTGGSGGSGPVDALRIPDTASGTCSSDKDCTPLGLLCDVRIEKCVQCRNDLECGGGKRCAGGSCQMVVACKTSLDCAGVQNNENICDPGSGECVQCTKSTDCPMNHECAGRRCVAYTPCQNSLQCPGGQVCHPQLDRCFECVADADCGVGEVCAGNTCRTGCKSDNQCTTAGLLCNTTAGYCAACLDDRSCPESQHCAIGKCEDDVCTPGTSTCSGNSVLTCNTSGSGFTGAIACQARQTCVATGGVASCINWKCTAGQIECNTDNEIISCSADGLKIVATTDCKTNQQFCVNATCGDLVCTPNQRHCHQGSVYNCSANGLARTSYDVCDPQVEYCNSANNTAVCTPLVCMPNAPSCNANQATTCNAQGSGFTGGSTDCSQTNKVCVGGACLDAATDSILPAATMETSGSYFYGNKYQVTTNRTLVRIDFLSRASAANQTAIVSVYSATAANQNGVYTRVYVSPTPIPIAVGATSVTYTTGAFSVPLVAGNFYIIGFKGTGSVYQPYDAAASPTAVSFGSALGYDNTTTPTDSVSFGAHTTTYMFQQSLVTAAP